MDLTPLRFPHIADQVLEYLDNQNLVKFRMINRTWKIFIDEMTLPWKACPLNRLMGMYHENTDEWRTILTNCQTSYGIFADYTKDKMLPRDWKQWEEGKLDLTPLHIAALTGQIEKFSDIFNEVEEKNPGDFRQTTVFHITAAKGYYGLCEMIISEMIDKNPKNVYHVAPLHLATKNEHYEICRLILDNAIDAEDDTNLVARNDPHYHDSPFFLALTGGHLNLCKLFIEYGKYYSFEDWIFAMKNETFKPEVLVMAITTLIEKRQVERLYQNGYFRFLSDDMNWYNNDSHELIMCQLVGELQKNIMNLKPNRTPLHYAAKIGNLDLCKQIFKYIENKNPKDSFEMTPFHIAASEGNFEICELIIHNIKDKNPHGINSITPLHLAAQKNHLLVCELIIDNIDEKKLKNPLGGSRANTPLHLAAQKGHLAVCKLIIKNIDEKNPLDLEGNTPLHLANKNGHTTVANFLQKEDLESLDFKTNI